MSSSTPRKYLRSCLSGRKRINSNSASSLSSCYPLYCSLTGNVRAEVESASRADCESAISDAADAQGKWYRETSPLERSQLLLAAADKLMRDREEIAVLETEDTGRPLQETRYEAAGAAECLQWFAGLCRSVGGQTFDLPSSSSRLSCSNNWGYTKREPLGVTVGIGAWNYPMQSVIWKSAPALAFGNTQVFKPSEFTPQTALKVAQVYQEVGIPDGVFQVLLGDGVSVGKTLVEDPRVAKVSFTGSVDTGRKIYKSAANDFKKVTLELGGKSPLILWDDTPIETAVSAATMANWFSSGQVCSNGTRVFVHTNFKDHFMERLIERTSQLIVGDPMDDSTQIGPLIHNSHMKKVEEYIRIGVQEDQAELVYGGARILTSEYPNGNFLSPAIFLCSHDDMRIVREEVFGMLMSILTFESEDEVVERANNTPMGLAAGVFTKDLARAHRIVSRLNAGITWINHYNLAPTELPWGGFQHSGIGSENGLAVVESWTRTKSVYVEMDEMESPF